MSDLHVPFVDPWFPDGAAIGRAHDEIVASGWFTNHGPRERELAAAIGAFVGPGVHASVMGNATSALVLALRALLGQPDGHRNQVLIQSFTFAAGAEAILWNGFEPVFVDLDPGTWHADLAQVERYVTLHPERVAAILLCNTFGVGVPAIDAWEDLAARAGVPLVIDSAAGFGSEYAAGERLGGRGACEVFSFHATKPFAIGEGGAVTSRDAALIAELDQLQNFGFGADRRAVSLGLNAKLPELPCAIGLLQLEGFADRLVRRRACAERYADVLAPFPVQPGSDRSSVAFVSTRIADGVSRDAVMADLGAAGVESHAYYRPALHEQPLFAKCPVAERELPVTEGFAHSILSLPVSERLAAASIDRIGAIVHARRPG